jgi:hypothetical protein
MSYTLLPPSPLAKLTLFINTLFTYIHMGIT